MEIKQNELVLVNFPFSDLSSNKVRPVLIISNNNFNKFSEDFLGVPLTSVLKNVPYSLNINQNDMVKGNLIVKSRIRVDKITAIKKNIIKMRIGVVDSRLVEKVKEEFKLML